MSDRFSNLQPFLPPPRDRAPVDDPQETKLRARPRRRLRIGSLRTWMRMTGLVTVTVLVAVVGGGAAARLTLDGDAFTPPEIRPTPVRVAAPGGAPAAPVRADRVLGVRHRSTRPSHRPTRKEPRPARRARRVPRSAVAAPVAAPAASPAPQPASDHRPVRHRPKPSPAKKEKQEATPPPPNTPLFDCYSGKKVDHYMTSDRASAAEAESSTAEYQCDIVGYVYNYSAPNTRSIEIDSGIAFVFSKKGAPTEPDVRTVGLYRHEAGYDYWYETHPSDTGFVGYLKP